MNGDDINEIINDDFDEIHGVSLNDSSRPLRLYANQFAVASMQRRIYFASLAALFITWLMSGFFCHKIETVGAPTFAIISTFIAFLCLALLRQIRKFNRDLRTAPSFLELTQDSIIFRGYAAQFVVTIPWAQVKSIESSESDNNSTLTIEVRDINQIGRQASDAKTQRFLLRKFSDGRLVIPTTGLPLKSSELNELLKRRMIVSIED